MTRQYNTENNIVSLGSPLQIRHQKVGNSTRAEEITLIRMLHTRMHGNNKPLSLIGCMDGCYETVRGHYPK